MIGTGRASREHPPRPRPRHAARWRPPGHRALPRRARAFPAPPDLVCERIAVALLGADPRVRRLPDGRWGLVPEAQGSPLLDECAFAVVDVETTGMRAAGSDRITEIAVVVRPRRPARGDLRALVNPERPIPPVDQRHHRHHRRHGARRAALRRAGRPAARGARGPRVRGPQRPLRLGLRQRRAAARARPRARGPPPLHRAAGAPARAGCAPAGSTPEPLLRHRERRAPPRRRRRAGHRGAARAAAAPGAGRRRADAAGPRRHRGSPHAARDAGSGSAMPTEPRADSSPEASA